MYGLVSTQRFVSDIIMHVTYLDMKVHACLLFYKRKMLSVKGFTGYLFCVYC